MIQYFVVLSQNLSAFFEGRGEKQLRRLVFCNGLRQLHARHRLNLLGVFLELNTLCVKSRHILHHTDAFVQLLRC